MAVECNKIHFGPVDNEQQWIGKIRSILEHVKTPRAEQSTRPRMWTLWVAEMERINSEEAPGSVGCFPVGSIERPH